jgi:hypothetical protein
MMGICSSPVRFRQAEEWRKCVKVEIKVKVQVRSKRITGGCAAAERGNSWQVRVRKEPGRCLSVWQQNYPKPGLLFVPETCSFKRRALGSLQNWKPSSLHQPIAIFRGKY